MPITRTNPRRPAARRGIAAPFLIVSSVVFLAAFALAINHAWLSTIRTDMQLAADAAALAAVQSLVGDDLLRGDPAQLPDLIASASEEARRYARENHVRGGPFVLQPNPTNHPDGDLVFGTLQTPKGREMSPATDLDSTTNPALRTVNTVRVNGRLTRARGNAPGMIFAPFAGNSAASVYSRASATLDRGIRGLRPGKRPVPLAPLALLSDSIGADPKSWDFQIESGNALDQYRFDGQDGSFEMDPAGDGLREFIAALATDPQQAGTTNVSLVFLGTNSIGGIAAQLQQGVSAGQLQLLDGELVLPAGGSRLVAGTDQGAAVGSLELTAIVQVLNELREDAAVRIWPLYTAGPGGSSQVRLCGFVAARVVVVVPPAPDQPLQFTLQPTMTSQPAAVTDTDLRGRAATMNQNPYICKVRRVE